MRELIRPNSCVGVLVWMKVGSATSLLYDTPIPTRHKVTAAVQALGATPRKANMPASRRLIPMISQSHRFGRPVSHDTD